MFFDETIAAISTPHGRGGIAVIRISGRDAIGVAGKVFIPFGRQFHGRIEELPDRYAAYGKVMSEGKRLDDCIATVFRAPDSYTGEDVVEISCHGGVLLTQTILGELFAAGAVQAGRGEFTRRAFVSGKLSLSQAESVIGLIDAESRAQLRLQSSQRQGVLTAALDRISKRIMRLVTSIYAYIDFPDEDMTDVSTEEMALELRDILGELNMLENTYRTGHAVAEGIKTVIAGLPNTGKSSLLNLLLGSRRAIVTDIEGTTRDAIEETAFAGEVMLRLCDTAGIRESDDRVEMLGVEIAQQRMKEAQLILAVFDASRPLDEKARQFASSLAGLDCEKIIVLNKSDLGEAADAEETAALTGTESGRIVRMCCADFESEEGKRSRGMLCAKIEELFTDGSLDYDSDAVIVNARQYADVHSAAEAVRDALGALESMQTQDIAGLDLERALTALAEADGRAVTDEIVDGIFHNFCVGK